MRIDRLVALALLASACRPAQDDADVGASKAATDQSPSESRPRPTVPMGAADRWSLQAKGQAVTLALLDRDSSPTIRLICPSGRNQLLVNVPGFRPIGSEERLSFGGGGDAWALVADTRGDAARGGVSGVGEIPKRLAAILRSEVSASYGAQRSGPHPPPPQRLADAFATACGSGAPAPIQAKSPLAETTSACLMQGSERLHVMPRRAVGTEPFWAARIEGRCVTYSHPDDQSGTRVWTRYSSGPDGETWSGALGQRLFELRIRNEPGCSDGMSDRRYPLGVRLIVNGERRNGCAEPTSG